MTRIAIVVCLAALMGACGEVAPDDFLPGQDLGGVDADVPDGAPVDDLANGEDAAQANDLTVEQDAALAVDLAPPADLTPAPDLAPSCEGLAKKYLEEIASAKTCQLVGADSQCKTLRPATIGCGCDTHVNNDATATLDDLIETYAKAGCVGPCTKIACPDPGEGGCVAAGPSLSIGQCVDGAK